MGDLAINTPQALVQCQNVTITWTGGVAPYYAGYIASGTIQSAATPSPAVSFQTDQMMREWQCDVAAGVTITLTVRDSNGMMVYSSPSTVQNSSDTSCLPGYSAPDSSSGLSGGAIGGIVGGIIGGLLLLGIVLGLLWKRRKRRRAVIAGHGYRNEKEPIEIEPGEPRVEPYIGRGEVDLGPGENDHPETTTTTMSESVPTDLERQTKQMLGVTSTSASASTSTPSRSYVPPITGKSNLASSPIDTTTQSGDSSSPTTMEEARRASPVRREQEVEYVRHTDGGMVQVELPPLYSDVPRQG